MLFPKGLPKNLCVREREGETYKYSQKLQKWFYSFKYFFNYFCFSCTRKSIGGNKEQNSFYYCIWIVFYFQRFIVTCVALAKWKQTVQYTCLFILLLYS